MSAMLRDGSLPARAVERGTQTGWLLMSDETLAKLGEVALRPKFNKYLPLEDRLFFLERLMPLIKIIPVMNPVTACRDPKDDKFLEVAVNGGASCIVTGDADR
jgi:putative PIN family toxin of toxin-antitoxin system